MALYLLGPDLFIDLNYNLPLLNIVNMYSALVGTIDASM